MNPSPNAGDLDAGSIPGLRAWQPTPVFLPGESPGQRSPWSIGSERVRHNLSYLAGTYIWQEINFQGVS